MGKSLIINGADFSVNAINGAPLPTSMDITSILPALKIGYVYSHIYGFLTNVNRTTLNNIVDISTYKTLYGFDHIRVETVVSGISAVPVVIGDASSAQSWTDTSWPLGNNTEICVNINTGTPGTTVTADIIKVILYKE